MRVRGMILASAIASVLSGAPAKSVADSALSLDSLPAAGTSLRALGAEVVNVGNGYRARPALIGEVEAIGKGGEIQVAGQTVRSLGPKFQSLQIGQYVVVDGVVSPEGIRAEAISKIDSAFVPGASLVLVSGFITNADVSLGRLSIGALEADITPALYETRTELRAGDFVQLIGIQPVSAGVLVGSDYNAIIGGDRTNAIIGGDRSDAIIGGDRSDAIIGGDRTNAIIGGDRTNAIIGGDRTNAIIGGDRTNAIIGGDRTNAIIGGDRTDAIIGGDRTDAIIGGDRTNAIIGGDRTNAIIGGDRTNAIIGGDRTNAIIGGDQSDAIIGGDRTAAAIGNSDS